MTEPGKLRRRLKLSLRKAREAAGLTPSAAAARLGWPADVLARMESGQSLISERQVPPLLAAYGVTDPAAVASILELVRQVQCTPWKQYADVFPPGVAEFLALEASASLIRQFEQHLIPGLLQTPDYTRAMLRGTVSLDPVSIERSVEARARRQELLARERPPELFFIVAEAAVRQQVGGAEVMAAQLQHLMSVAAQECVHLQLVPAGTDAHPGMLGPFVVFEFDTEEEPDALYLEHRDHFVIQDDESPMVQQAVHRFWDLERIALSTEETLSAIAGLVEIAP